MKHKTMPSCGTCIHWGGVPGQEYCSRYLVLTERDKGSGMERGDVLPVEARGLIYAAQTEYLRPRSHFVCEQWRSASNETLLDPVRFPPESHGYRLERNELIDKSTTEYAAELQRDYIESWGVEAARPRRRQDRTNQTLLRPIESDRSGNALWLEATG